MKEKKNKKKNKINNKNIYTIAQELMELLILI